MTAKESKAVASVCLTGDLELYAHGEFANVQMQLFGGYKPKISDKLVMLSALHAAEAELGELRRRLGEMADAVWPIPPEAMGSVCISSDVFDFSQKQFIRQLLATDGGADGDNEGEKE